MKGDRFERLVDKNSYSAITIHRNAAIRLLRAEHNAVVRMVKAVIKDDDTFMKSKAFNGLDEEKRFTATMTTVTRKAFAEHILTKLAERGTR